MEIKETLRKQQEDTIVATRLRRQQLGGYIKSFIGRLQNAVQKSGTMGRVLQPTTRIGETTGGEGAKTRRDQRNSELSRLLVHPGWKHIQNLLEVVEGDAYYSLRVPHEVRDKAQSLEYFIGFQAGRLAVVDDIRTTEVETRKAIEHMRKDKDGTNNA